MKEIDYKYLERLINLRDRNRSLVDMFLPKKRTFDIFKLFELDGSINSNHLYKQRSDELKSSMV